MNQEITCRDCRKKFNSNQTIIRKEELLEEVRILGNIQLQRNVITQDIYIAECPYCGAVLAERPISY